MAYRKTRITNEPVRNNTNDVATNLDKNFHYVLVHKDGQNGEEDMAQWMDLGYEPARGEEKLKGTPFTNPENHPDGLKIRGNRILMRCPLDEYKKRKQQDLLEQNRRAGKDGNKQDAQRIAREQGVSPGLVQASDDISD